MARPRKKKTGVMAGFPKLAFYIGPEKLIDLRTGTSYWDFVKYNLTPSELVVLVATGVTDDFSNRVQVPGQWWFTYPKIGIYYIVPMRALNENMAPITSVYNWKERYRTLPKLNENLFTVIEKEIGERATSPADAV